MNAIARRTASFVSFAFLAASASRAQSAPAQPTPPFTPALVSAASSQLPAPQAVTSAVPAQIASAHTVFLTNMGADPNFPIDVTAAYNDIYAKLQTWGRYQLVSAPSQADLVFQLHDIAPISDISGVRGEVSTTTSPSFQLTILDPKLNIPLYTLTSPVTVTGSKSKREHWVDVAEINLVSRLKVLASQPLSNIESADLTTVPTHRSRATLGWIIGGSLVGVGIAGGFILHHAFENSLASQKTSQDAFCNANHIPLSECAGG